MNPHKSNLGNVASRYVKLLNIPVTSTTIKNAIRENPYYPSLYSLSSTFDRYDIANQAFNLASEEMHNLEAPFIAFYHEPDLESDFILVTKLSSSEVEYLADGSKVHRASLEKFKKYYKGVVFVAEAKESSGEKNYVVKLEDERKASAKKHWLSGIGVLAVLALCILFFIPVLQNFSWVNLGNMAWIAAAKAIGVFAVALLFVYEVDKTNSIVKSLCSVGKQTSCDAVLNSKASKIFGLSWSEIGAYYFLATSLFLLAPGIAFQSKAGWLALGSSVASPYIIFSLYYQWRVIKKWCALCLMIQAALILEFSWSVTNFWLPNNSFTEIIRPEIFLVGFVCLLLPMLAWNILKTLLIESKRAPEFEASYKRMLFNPEIFHGLLQLQPGAEDGWQSLGITIGNPDAPNTIIKVCNPYCGPCAKAHPVLDEIIHRNKAYKLKVIFTSKDSPSDPGGIVAKHLLAVAAKGDESKTKAALDDWYLSAKKDYSVFAGKYPLNGEVEAQSNNVQAMSKWCHDTNIAYTPTIFLNGKRLPDTYTIEELKNIL